MRNACPNTCSTARPTVVRRLPGGTPGTAHNTAWDGPRLVTAHVVAVALAAVAASMAGIAVAVEVVVTGVVATAWLSMCEMPPQVVTPSRHRFQCHNSDCPLVHVEFLWIYQINWKNDCSIRNRANRFAYILTSYTNTPPYSFGCIFQHKVSQSRTHHMTILNEYTVTFIEIPLRKRAVMTSGL